MLLDLTDTGRTGKEVEQLLDRVNITVNKNTIPFETQSPFITSGIRIGTPSVTTRGMKEYDMSIIANLITAMIKKGEDASAEVRMQVQELCKRYPLYKKDVR